MKNWTKRKNKRLYHLSLLNKDYLKTNIFSSIDNEYRRETCNYFPSAVSNYDLSQWSEGELEITLFCCLRRDHFWFAPFWDHSGFSHPRSPCLGPLWWAKGLCAPLQTNCWWLQKTKSRGWNLCWCAHPTHSKTFLVFLFSSLVQCFSSSISPFQINHIQSTDFQITNPNLFFLFVSMWKASKF